MLLFIAGSALVVVVALGGLNQVFVVAGQLLVAAGIGFGALAYTMRERKDLL